MSRVIGSPLRHAVRGGGAEVRQDVEVIDGDEGEGGDDAMCRAGVEGHVVIEIVAVGVFAGQVREVHLRPASHWAMAATTVAVWEPMRSPTQ
jgi:hypothetical protein